MSSSKIVVGFLAGAAVGALAGILFAPDKGSSTRRKIANKTGDLTDKVKNSFSEFIDGVKETYAGAEAKAEEFADKAKAGITKGKEEFKNALS